MRFSSVFSNLDPNHPILLVYKYLAKSVSVGLSWGEEWLLYQACSGVCSGDDFQQHEPISISLFLIFLLPRDLGLPYSKLTDRKMPENALISVGIPKNVM